MKESSEGDPLHDCYLITASLKNVLRTRCKGNVARLKSMKGVSTNNRTYIILHNPVLVLFVINLHYLTDFKFELSP